MTKEEMAKFESGFNEGFLYAAQVVASAIIRNYHYDKTSGENYGFGSDLAQLVALKGRITLQENRIREYIEANKGSLFFDEATDPQLLKVRAKLERAKENVAQAEARLKAKVERLKQQL